MVPVHGRPLRGLSSVTRPDVPFGRFGRMFPFLPPAQYGQTAEEALTKLATAMVSTEFAEADKKAHTDPNTEHRRDPGLCETEPEDENPTIPAGYTYLGQFINHDISFDPVSTLQAQHDPDALEDFRTPRLDLDSLYGRGVADQPYLYAHDAQGNPTGKFLLGPDRRAVGGRAPRPDVPRNAEGVALIGDPRNDENRIVVQLHSLFLRFHNALCNTHMHLKMPARFTEVQRLVRWHYQWIVLHDFLPRIVGLQMAHAVLNPGGVPNLLYYRLDHATYPFMPVEFSVAAYRFGHSMVRPTYALNQVVVAPGAGKDQHRFHRIPLFTADTEALANLNGLQAVPEQWGIDWSFFFDRLPVPAPEHFRHQPSCAAAPPVLPQPSYRIDTELADPLGTLQGDPPPELSHNSLALRNLRRGLTVGLPNGQSVAQALGVAPIPDHVLWETDKHQTTLQQYPQFAHNAPLWFYILKEAQLTKHAQVPDAHGGHHLGPVGGRIVAEVLGGLVYYDTLSFLRQAPQWRPQPPIARADGTFDMAQLITFTDQHASE